MPAPSEYLYLGIGEVDLGAVAVEFDLVNPTIATRRFPDRGRQRGLNEAWEGRPRADRAGFVRWNAAALHQAHRQRQLNVVVSAFVLLDEILQIDRDVAQLQIAAPAQLVGNVARDVSCDHFSAVLKPTTRTGLSKEVFELVIVSMSAVAARLARRVSQVVES